MKKQICTYCFILSCFFTSGAQTKVIMAAGLNLPMDSLQGQKLISALGAFLNSIEAAGADNPLVAGRNRAETFDLMDEMRGIQKSRKYGEDHFYKPYLNSVVLRSDSSFLVQLSFVGVRDSNAFPRAIFNLICYSSADGKFCFSSPLAFYTRGWKVRTISSARIHYPDRINLELAARYCDYVSRFDKKLSAGKSWMEYYCCSDVSEALQVLGVSMKTDYSGRKRLSLSSSYKDTTVVVAGNAGGGIFEFDPHDLWHSHLRNAVGSATINKAVDEGCAYLYGGSWGFSWNEIFRKFLDTLGGKPQQDWLQLYGSNKVFYSDKGRSELIVPYVINALIVQRLEQEQGFPAVMKLLRCGPVEADNAAYFNVLQQLSGISRAGFNKAVDLLIAQEVRRGKVHRTQK